MSYEKLEKNWNSRKMVEKNNKYGNVCMMKTTIELPDKLYTKVKTEAVLRGTIVKDILIHLLEVEMGLGEFEIQKKTLEKKHPFKKFKKNLQVQFSNFSHNMKSLPEAKILQKFDFDPLDFLQEDRVKRNDFLLS